MEQRRIRSRLSSDEEEKEHTRISPRKLKRVRYIVDDNEDEDEEEDEEEEDYEPPGASTYNQRALENKSEKGSTEDTEENDVKDDSWSPGSRGLNLDTEEDEEENEAGDNGGDVVNSADDTSQEEEIEDEAMSPSVFEERGTKQITSAPKKMDLLQELRVVIKRLPEATRDCLSNDMEHPLEGSWCEPLTDAQTEESRECSGPAIGDPLDSSQTSDETVIGGIMEENGEEVTESHEIKTQRPLCAPATSVRDTNPEILVRTGDIGSTSTHTADLSGSPMLMVTHGTGNGFRDIQRCIKEESIEAMNGHAATSGHDAAQLPVMELKARVPQTSESPQSSNMEERPVSTSSSLDTMDLDQLKREKIKMQLKVLKLQDEYYSLKIKRLKK